MRYLCCHRALVAAAFIGLFVAPLPTAQAAAPEESKAEVVRIDHEPRTIEGWTVHVDQRLLGEEHGELGQQALRILANKLYEVVLVLPADRVERLKQVPIWIDLDHPLKNMQYHPDKGWLEQHGYDPAMAKAVHIPNVQYMIRTQQRNVQPWVVLHELAHAYHDRELGFDDPLVRQTFDQVVASKRYEEVLHIAGRKQRHYALSNHKEYFAEMTESFFGTNDFYPFVRAELEEYDPETWRMLEQIWIKPLTPAQD